MYDHSPDKENIANAGGISSYRRVISAQAEVWEGPTGSVSQIKKQFNKKYNGGKQSSHTKTLRTPGKVKVAEMQQKLTDKIQHQEVISTPSKIVNIPANKVTEMKEKIVTEGIKSRQQNVTPSKSLSIPMNKVNEIRQLLASLEQSSKGVDETMTSSKKRAVIDTRMNSLSDIMKWIEEVNYKSRSVNQGTTSKRDVLLPINRVNEMKNWLIAFERQQKEHSICLKQFESLRNRVENITTPPPSKKIEKNSTVSIQSNDGASYAAPKTEVANVKDIISWFDEIYDRGDANEMNKIHSPKTALPKEHFDQWLDTKTTNKDGKIKTFVDCITMTPPQHSDAVDDEDWDDIFAELSKSGSSDVDLMEGNSVMEEGRALTEEDDALEDLLDTSASTEHGPNRAVPSYEVMSTQSLAKVDDIRSEFSFQSDRFDSSSPACEELANETKAENSVFLENVGNMNLVPADPFQEQEILDMCQIASDTQFSKFHDKFLDDHSSSLQEYDSDTSPFKLLSPEMKKVITRAISFTNSNIDSMTAILSVKSDYQMNDGGSFTNNQVKALVPWRAIGNSGPESPCDKTTSKEKHGVRKFLKTMTRILSKSIKSRRARSGKTLHSDVPLANTLSESDVGSDGTKSPKLSQVTGTKDNPWDHSLRVRENELLSRTNYLPQMYGCSEKEKFQIVPFQGSATPDKSVASAYERALSPDSSQGSTSYGEYALVPAKKINVAQHVSWMRGIFGSPIRYSYRNQPAAGSFVSFVTNKAEL